MKQVTRRFGVALVAMVIAAMAGMTLRAQENLASIHGHVNNPVGQPVPGAQIRMADGAITDIKSVKWAYTFPIDANGNYKGTGIVPKSYTVVVFAPDASGTPQSIDFLHEQVLKAGEDKQVDFDMSRKEFIDKMTPEEKKQLEEYKKKNADVSQANAKIANLNATLAKAREDNKSGNYDAAVVSMTAATQQAPDEAILWLALADAQLGQADTAAKAAKAAGTSTTGQDIVDKYSAAAASYKKAIDLNAASKKPNPETAGAAYNQIGLADGRSGNAAGASEAFDNAAKAVPAKAGMYYFNEAATLYNAGKNAEAGAAADKTIAADPTKAEAYYIKAQTLIPQATVDPKTSKIVAPPGCVDAYQKYLELAPDGPHAEEVKQILEGIGEKVKSTYKAPKK